MSNMVTRCPKCATSFRITSAQLQSAKGAVRCGSCLHIFKAQDHLVSTPAPSPVANTPSAVSSTPKANSSPKTAQSTPKVISAPPVAVSPPTSIVKPTNAPVAAKAVIDMSKRPVVRDTSAAQPPLARAAKASVSTVAAVKPQPTTPQPPITPQAAIKADTKPETQVTSSRALPDDDEDIEQFLFSQEEIDQELAALGEDDDLLISDDMDGDSPKMPQVEELGFADFSLDIPGKNSTSLFERNARDDAPEEDEGGTDESWAESLLDEANEETRAAGVKQRLSETEDDADPLWIAESPEDHDYSTQEMMEEDAETQQDFRSMFAEEELSDELRTMSSGRPLTPSSNESDPEPGADARPTQSAPIRAYDTSRAALLMNITPEPVIMTGRRKRSWQRKRLWPRLSLLMVIVLLAQIAWLQFDTLSRIHPYRSGYEFICPYLGCQVPALVDRSKIRVRNLLVRKHPDIDQALMVDVIIINTAPFNQVFPDLIMDFSDIDDKPVASRRFTPREYLRGELAGYDLMPQNQPVHINLELVDPGEEAVNYKIEPF